MSTNTTTKKQKKPHAWLQSAGTNTLYDDVLELNKETEEEEEEEQNYMKRLIVDRMTGMTGMTGGGFVDDAKKKFDITSEEYLRNLKNKATQFGKDIVKVKDDAKEKLMGQRVTQKLINFTGIGKDALSERVRKEFGPYLDRIAATFDIKTYTDEVGSRSLIVKFYLGHCFIVQSLKRNGIDYRTYTRAMNELNAAMRKDDPGVFDTSDDPKIKKYDSIWVPIVQQQPLTFLDEIWIRPNTQQQQQPQTQTPTQTQTLATVGGGDANASASANASANANVNTKANANSTPKKPILVKCSLGHVYDSAKSLVESMIKPVPLTDEKDENDDEDVGKKNESESKSKLTSAGDIDFSIRPLALYYMFFSHINGKSQNQNDSKLDAELAKVTNGGTIRVEHDPSQLGAPVLKVIMGDRFHSLKDADLEGDLATFIKPEFLYNA